MLEGVHRARTSRWTRSSTASRSRRPSRPSSPRPASSSCRSRRPSASTPTSCGSTRLGRAGDGQLLRDAESAVFSDGSFVYIPPGVRCPMELSTYFRINERNTGQFERTLIIANKGAYVTYLEGCTAPRRERTSFTRPSLIRRSRRCDIKYSTVQNWLPATPRQGRHLQLRHQARRLRATTRSSRGRRSRPGPPSRGSIRPASCAATIRRGEFYSIRDLQRAPAGR